MSSSSSRLGLFETRYSDFEALSWKRPPIARARRRRSNRSISLSLWKTIRSSSVASTCVFGLQLDAVEHGRTLRNALTCTFKPKVTSSALSRERERSSSTSSASLFTRTKICGSETFFLALK